MDKEAWQATVHRVAESWTRLKRLTMQAELQVQISGSDTEL